MYWRRVAQATPHPAAALQAVRLIDLADPWLAAGCPRNPVFDLSHDGMPEPPRDIDAAYFDPSDPTGDGEPAIKAELTRLAPQVT